MEMALNMQISDTVMPYAQIEVQISTWNFCITKIHVGGKEESLSGWRFFWAPYMLLYVFQGRSCRLT